MYNIILDGEVVETINYNNLYDVRQYISQEYHYYGEYPIIQEVKEWTK